MLGAILITVMAGGVLLVPLNEGQTLQLLDSLVALQAAGGDIRTRVAELSMHLGRPNDGIRGNTLLHLAAANGHTKAIQVLVATGASLEAKMVGTNERGRYESTPLQLAAGSGKVAAIRALIAAGASLKDGLFSPLHMAAQDGHALAIAVLADAGASLEAVDKDGNTPLHEATTWGHAGAIKALVAAGAPLEAKSDAGLTPLRACDRGAAGIGCLT